MINQSPLPYAPSLPIAPLLPPIDPSTLTPPQVMWFDGATGELTGSYPQTLDQAATRAAWQVAYDAEIALWQAACAALPASTLPGTYPAPPAVPPLAASAVWLMDAYHMTHVAPPALQAGFRPVFDKAAGTWSQIEDHRNLPLWDASGNRLPHMTVLGPIPAGALLVQPAPTAAQIAATLASAKLAALAGVIAAANGVSSAVTAAYPMAEQQTWPDQLAEAIAFSANNAAPTPLLDTLIAAAAAGGVPTAAQIAAVTAAQRAALAASVVAKAAGLRTIAVAIATLRTTAQAAIAAAPDVAGLATTMAALETHMQAVKAALGL